MTEQRCLDGHVLDNRLDDKIRGGKTTKVGHDLDPRKSPRGICFRQFAARDQRRPVSGNAVTPTRRSALYSVIQHHTVVYAGSNSGDSGPHAAGADDSDNGTGR